MMLHNLYSIQNITQTFILLNIKQNSMSGKENTFSEKRQLREDGINLQLHFVHQCAMHMLNSKYGSI